MSQQLNRSDPDERLDDLEAEIQALNDATTFRAEQLAEANQRITQLEAENDELRDIIDEQRDIIDMLNRERTRLTRRLSAVEEELGIDAATANAFGDGFQRSPLYLLETVGPEGVADNPGPTLQRAYQLVLKKDEWGEVRTNQKYGHHRLLASREHDLKQRLSDRLDESIRWAQVYRAMEKLADLGGAHVQFVEEYASAEQSYGKAVVWTEVER